MPPQIYRKFEVLNHRVLQHLQEDIAQMEEDLAALDEFETMHRAANPRIHGRQRSRRHDTQYEEHPSFHQRRVDLIERILLKTEQYSKYFAKYFDLTLAKVAKRSRPLLLQQSNSNFALSIEERCRKL
jgi:hypothetical protein